MCIYLEVVNGDPGVSGKALDIRHKELHATVPVSKEENGNDKVADSGERLRCIEQLDIHRESISVSDNRYIRIANEIINLCT